MKKILPFIIILLLAAACAPASDYEGAPPAVNDAPGVAEDAAWFEPEPAAEAAVVRQSLAENSAGVQANLQTATSPERTSPERTNPERIARIVRRANVEMSVYTEGFDAVARRLNEIADERGGFIESSNFSSHTRFGNTETWRLFEIVLRVPNEQFSETLLYVESLADVTSSGQSAEDITERFYDTGVRMESRRVEEARLLDLVSEAANLQELLILEDRLGHVRTQIEVYQAQINNMGRQAALSTIVVSLTEVLHEIDEEPPATFGQRIGGAFGDSVSATGVVLQEVVVFLVGAAIPLAILGGAAVVVILIVKKSEKNTEKGQKNGPI